MLKLKAGVKLWGLQPQMLIAKDVIKELFDKEQIDCVITAGSDGTHQEQSQHYSGNALDFRTRDLKEGRAAVIVAAAQEALGADFFVQFEGDHIHVQYKPRR